jgi:hypothetical protein
LGDARMVEMLADFRNDLMHGGPLLGEEVGLFFDHMTEVHSWALKLRQACEREVVIFFATPRSNESIPRRVHRPIVEGPD